MEFADLDLVPAQAGQRLGRLLVFHRQVAGVVSDAQALRQADVAGMLVAQTAEKLHRLRRRLQKGQRLRLQAQVQNPPALFGSADEYA